MISETMPRLPHRPIEGHKGTFGTVVVVAGSTSMIGAPCFVALGALRVGCGSVRLMVPSEILTACLSLVPSAIGIPQRPIAAAIDALAGPCVLAAGPGIGLDREAEGLIRDALKANAPLVLDGDGLTHLAHMGRPALPRQAPLVLTPHPGEYARLAEIWGTVTLTPDSRDVQRRTEAATELARATGAIVVLKGHGTIVSDGSRSWTCSGGSAALAIPGSGDVLTGVIAGLMSQGQSPGEAAQLGTHLHASAGDLWIRRKPFGMLAPELADLVPVAAQLHLEANERDHRGKIT